MFSRKRSKHKPEYFLGGGTLPSRFALVYLLDGKRIDLQCDTEIQTEDELLLFRWPASVPFARFRLANLAGWEITISNP